MKISNTLLRVVLTRLQLLILPLWRSELLQEGLELQAFLEFEEFGKPKTLTCYSQAQSFGKRPTGGQIQGRAKGDGPKVTKLSQQRLD